MKIQVVFYSMYGHIYRMAEAVAAGARAVDGADVTLYQVPELVPEAALEKSGAKAARAAFAHVPMAQPNQLAEADAILFGTPTRFGNMCAQMRNFLDQTGGLWVKGSLIGKVGSVFASTGTQHGGQETTITSFHTTLLHLGLIIVGVPYSEAGLTNMKEITGGTPYGATTLAGADNSRQPSENELGIARFQGRHVAEITRKLVGEPVVKTGAWPMAANDASDRELKRLLEDAQRKKNWKRWGPYLSERQWATVREDYSPNGSSWEYFPHDQARSRAYRWGEDGLLGITDRQCRLCFALALWNGRDPILKERLFGLTGPEGNHGEDVKECYYYLDSTPTHSYLKALYKYPQQAFPYAQLVEENRRRSRNDQEFELLDTGIFDHGRYFDIVAEYAKASPNDLLIRITAANRSSEVCRLHLLPTLWFRNTWSWGCTHEGHGPRPEIRRSSAGTLLAEHHSLGRFTLAAAPASTGVAPDFLFTENETNRHRLYGTANVVPHVKDAFHEYVVGGHTSAVNAEATGTKTAAHYVLEVPADGQVSVCLRLFAEEEAPRRAFGAGFARTFEERIRDADAFYGQRIPPGATDDERRIARQAYAGLLWSKQFYHYVVQDWLQGDPGQPAPPALRLQGRNSDWNHLFNRDVLSMPDKWEYPWYAAWDLAFHMIPFARLDSRFAKEQMVLFLREWYMHPSGKLPAYEFGFDDVNPPVHAWACWRIYKMTGPPGQRDRLFLARVFQKLLINFTWWTNRKDIKGEHLFSGGFLGLDNIGLFDRSQPLPAGGYLEQADGTAWMAFYCATMLSMALELARAMPAYEDVASKFFEHFVAIADAMNTLGGTGLWDEQDGFYYDRLHVNGSILSARIRSMVGVIPLCAVEILEDEVIERLPGFRKRMQWFLDHRKDLAGHISYLERSHGDKTHGHRLLAIPSRTRLERALAYLLDENEFLSPFGIRSLSRYHRDHPVVCNTGGEEQRVEYVPGESTTALFGGNSNWRGPIWFPVNYLLVEALERYHHFYGDSLRVQCPTGSGRLMTLGEVAGELAQRLTLLFRADEAGRRACHGNDPRYAEDPHWRDLILFYEYFHGDTGRGLGASHQTGWTALVVRLLEDSQRRRLKEAEKKQRKEAGKESKEKGSRRRRLKADG